MEVPLEGLDHLRRLVLAHQAVVDVDAGELVADRLVDEQRGDRGVDPARERAEDALLADLGADALDLLLDHGRRRPGGPRAGDAVEEVLQHLLAVRRVHDLGVELDAVEAALRRLEGGDRRRLGAAGDGRRPRAARSRSRGGSSSRSAPPGGPRRARRPRGTTVLPNSPRGALDACRRGPGPSAACRSRCRARGRRARRAPGRPAARARRRPRQARRRGSRRRGSSREEPPRSSGGRRAPSRRAPRGRGGRSAGSTGRRGRRRARGRF